MRWQIWKIWDISYSLIHPQEEFLPTQVIVFYVDQLMTERDSEHEEKQALIQRVDKMEVLLKTGCNALANSTNYATMVSSPHYQNVTLKFVQLSQVDHEHLLAVIVTQGNIVKNKMIQVEEPLSNEDVLKIECIVEYIFTRIIITRYQPCTDSDDERAGGDQTGCVRTDS